ncbi:DUF3261 domain-containing protein [Acinetobacter sp. S40]|uniref:DUF3261 domain-containing protein n=1 Tax=unclassified Acinetobacter TaxID=196816 RepID=UPI0019099492|nr:MULTISPECIES: DUF3261 domain-containing protein [unclassified Acinetobacter]MBJ9985568.1 DUF3261 domain-containing protein [Acinetobacter sp. S40]MBK0064606.1 DUF3261 domain-containing protein [Acinetobacter sp. S55]MBK0068005.1 DUF3261 domain-containing protein [Acinetobacter sp. S54]
MQWIRLFVLSFTFTAFAGCQHIMPKAEGLESATWQQQAYQRQDQVDVQWHKQSFSFLLYQQQQGQVLNLIALSLTGQPLFQVEYNGQDVLVKQRIEQMRLLPFEFLVRDILWATYPDFPSQKSKIVEKKLNKIDQEIYIQKKLVLKIQHQHDQIYLDNIQVPYQMTFSPIENTLQSNE